MADGMTDDEFDEALDSLLSTAEFEGLAPAGNPGAYVDALRARVAELERETRLARESLRMSRREYGKVHKPARPHVIGYVVERWDETTARAEQAEAERDGLRAARIAYASEFDGDVGSVHENIRRLKDERNEALNRDARIRAEAEAKAARLQSIIDAVRKENEHGGYYTGLPDSGLKSRIARALSDGGEP